MKKSAFALLCLVFLLSNAWAQQPGFGGRAQFSPEQRTKMRLERLTKELGLTPEQVKQMEVVFNEDEQQMAKMREEMGGDREAMRAKMEKFRADREARVSAILTPEQLKKYGEINARFQQRGQGMRPGGEPGMMRRGGEKMMKDSTQVKEKVKKVKEKKKKVEEEVKEVEKVVTD